MLGRVEGRPLTTGGLREGDLVGMTRHAGLEGTAILFAEHGDRLRAFHGEGAFDRVDQLLAGDWLLVAPVALGAAACRGVSALHDVTEGGVGEALHELAIASDLNIQARREDIPVLSETAAICSDLGLDPLGLIGSGSLLVGCDPEHRAEMDAVFAGFGVPFVWIGRAARGDSEPAATLPRFPRDELLRVSAMEGIEAVIFDMDGTLVDSRYDWPEIRQRLGVTGPSIIDDLNSLPEPDRTQRWAELERIEAAATVRATIHEGVRELLTVFADRGIPAALVTNNSDDNTHRLLERFALHFEVVVTRDSGLWKPSGAPITEAARRLDVAPERCLGVGDSRYDNMAARDAGLGRICVLHDGSGRDDGNVDLSFEDIPAFLRYLRIVLP